MASTLSLTGTGDILPDRTTSGEAPSLTMEASGAVSGSTDKAGGNLILSSGKSSGNNYSKIFLKAPAAKGSITQVLPYYGGKNYTIDDDLTIIGGDGSATVNVDTVGNNVVEILSMVFGCGYTTGVKNATGGSGSGCTVNITSVSDVGSITSIIMTNYGTGYVIGDMLSISGGTDGRIRVDLVSQGTITMFHLINGYGYTASISNDKTLAGGSGSGCKVFITSIQDFGTDTGQITGMTLKDGGSGYTAGNVLTVPDATGTGGRVKVVSVVNGAVKTVSIINGGSKYKMVEGCFLRGNPTSGGTGTGCTLMPWIISGSQDDDPESEIAISNGMVGIGTESPKGLCQFNNSYIIVSSPTGIAESDYQSIWTAIAAVGCKGTVYLQAGNYRIYGTLFFNICAGTAGLKLIGAGINATTITLDSRVGSPVIEIGSNNVSIKDLSLHSEQTEKIHTGIRISRGAQFTAIENVGIEGMNKGILVTDGGSINSYRDINIISCNTGVQLGDECGSSNWSNVNYFYGGRIMNCTDYGVRFIQGLDNVIYGLCIEGQPYGVSFEGCNEISGNTINGCHLEHNSSADVYMGSKHNKIMNCTFCSDTDIEWGAGSSGSNDENILIGNRFWSGSSREVVLSKLGIGTTSPAKKLEIVDSSAAQLRLSNTAGSKFADLQVDTDHDLTIKPSNNGQVILQPTLDSTDFFQVRNAAGTSVLNVDATYQRLGVGTPTPSALLHVSKNLAGAEVLGMFGQVGSQTVGYAAMLELNSGGTPGMGGSARISGVCESNAPALRKTGFGIYTDDQVELGITEKVRVTAKGLMGVGTASPSETITVSTYAVFDGVQHYTGSAFDPDRTAEAKSTGGTAYQVLATATINSLFYVGSFHKFEKMFFDIATAGVLPGTLSIEYWNGSAWSALPQGQITDGTNKLTQDGNITFPREPDWTTTIVNGSQSMYWVRLKTNQNPTTAPTAYMTIPDDGNRFGVYAQAGDSTPALLVNKYGFTGVGTASPGTKLQVNGNAAIGYSASTAGPTNGLAVSGSVAINLASPASPNTKLDLNGDFAIRENSPAQITANQNDYAIGSYSVLRLTSNGSYNITGFAGGVQGKFLYIINVNAYGSGRNLTLKHNQTSSSANRIYTPGGTDFVLSPGGAAILWYDSTDTKWRVLK
jgi:hypothetical protein